MNSHLTYTMAQQRQQDLLRAAARDGGARTPRRHRRRRLSLSLGLRRRHSGAVLPAS